jgi:hypothetical protein
MIKSKKEKKKKKKKKKNRNVRLHQPPQGAGTSRVALPKKESLYTDTPG